MFLKKRVVEEKQKLLILSNSEIKEKMKTESEVGNEC